MQSALILEYFKFLNETNKIINSKAMKFSEGFKRLVNLVVIKISFSSWEDKAATSLEN